jgi:hypothetical protein
VVKFDDGSMLLGHQPPTTPPEAKVDPWEVATRTGVAAIGAGVLVSKEHFPELEHALRAVYQLADNR